MSVSFLPLINCNGVMHTQKFGPPVFFVASFVHYGRVPCTNKLRFPLLFPMGSSSCGGDVTVNVFDINQPSLPTPFYSVLVLSLIHI